MAILESCDENVSTFCTTYKRVWIFLALVIYYTIQLSVAQNKNFQPHDSQGNNDIFHGSKSRNDVLIDIDIILLVTVVIIVIGCWLDIQSSEKLFIIYDAVIVSLNVGWLIVTCLGTGTLEDPIFVSFTVIISLVLVVTDVFIQRREVSIARTLSYQVKITLPLISSICVYIYVLYQKIYIYHT